MKGITPVIAIILLLLITIAMVGFTFVWFTRIQTDITQSVSNQTSQQARATGTSAKIDVIDQASGNVYIRNTGTQVILMNELSAYNNSVTLVSCGWTSGGPVVPGSGLPPNAVANCSAFADCSSVRITTIGTGDSRSC
ncbi:MAG: hypothetical protein HYY37_01305 [Candidatus Aenigmarchaeota archaeon]|nr:hypothetical protein [Candidatus Aenigmarchaeota archaeon]